jgi:hypothetical protein
MAPKKRGRPAVPSALTTLPNRAAYSHRSNAEVFQQRKADVENVNTVYGTVYKTMELPAEPGNKSGRAGPIKLEYTCPFAFLWRLCTLSMVFYRFFEANMVRLSQPPEGQAGPATRLRARIALYWDEVVPGNNMRPDYGRAYIAVYWTFVDLPMWFINGPIGWFTLCYVPLTTVSVIAGGVPMLCEALLRVFFPDVEEVMNFSIGVRLIGGQAGPADPLGFQNESFTFAADFAFWLADEAAFKKLGGVKGASGTKMCLCCQNTVGRCKADAIPEGSPLVHFTNPDVETLCVPHTPATLAECWLFLADQAVLLRQGRLTKKAFKQMEQCLGITFCVVSLLAPRINEIAQVPHSVFWDWMHCVVASGGWAQYELNQLLRRIQRLVPLDRLQDFATYVKFPKDGGFSPKLCLADRLRDKPHKHFKAFASEVLGWSIVVGLFCEMVLAPKGALPAEIACFRLLGRIIYLLRLGNGCVARLGRLKALLHEHQVQFMALYPEAATPKLHYTNHIPDCIARWGVLFACFATERKHRASKGIAAFAFKNWCLTLLRRTTRKHIEDALKAENFKPEKLEPPEGKAVLPKFQSLLARAGILGEAGLARMAKTARTIVGTLNAGDLLGVEAAGELRAGFAVEFFAVTRGGSEELFALVLVLRPLGGIRFSKAAAHTKLGFMHLSSVLHAFPHFVVGDDVHVVTGIDEFT